MHIADGCAHGNDGLDLALVLLGFSEEFLGLVFV